MSSLGAPDLTIILTLSPALLNTSTAVKFKCGIVAKISVTLLLWTSQLSYSEAVQEALIPCTKCFLR